MAGATWEPRRAAGGHQIANSPTSRRSGVGGRTDTLAALIIESAARHEPRMGLHYRASRGYESSRRPFDQIARLEVTAGSGGKDPGLGGMCGRVSFVLP